MRYNMEDGLSWLHTALRRSVKKPVEALPSERAKVPEKRAPELRTGR